MWKRKLEQQGKQRKRIYDHQRRQGEAYGGKRRVLPKQGMLRRSPNPRGILKGKYQHTEPIKYLQARHGSGDRRNGLRHRSRDIGDNQQDQDPVDGPRCRLLRRPCSRTWKTRWRRLSRLFGLGSTGSLRFYHAFVAPDGTQQHT